MSVQKYVVSKDETGFTMLKNHVLQNFKDAEALGVWVYLASLPPNWTFYKEQLRNHFNFGRERLNRVLGTLCQHNLITITNARDDKGRFIYMKLHVCSMHSFVVNAQPIQPAPVLDSEPPVQPCTGKPSTASQSLDNDTYKDISKKKECIEDISLIDSATDVAQKRANDDAFESYWKINPVKRNRIRAKRIWDKKKLYNIETVICADILNRLENDSQWQDRQFIPHPSTYLANELWNDEITQPSNAPKKSSGKSSSFDAYQAELKQQNRGVTYEHGAISR